MNKILSVMCTVFLAGGLGVVASSSGCTDDLDDDDGGDSGTGGNPDDMCPECDPGDYSVACGDFSTPSEPKGKVVCASVGCPQGYALIGPSTCDNQEADTDDGWDPSLGITALGNNSYRIDEDLWNNLLTNPFQLLHDDARVVPQNPYYEFSGVSNDDFFYQLGFRSGDKIKEINGESVATDNDAYTIYADFIEDTEFEVKVGRGQQTVTLNYEIE